ncbi:hypothetical protein C8Q74DRAFT_412102 [Fomes fomentarius]|nr:hypothetical protein C8Q74DRAFT_412102 [Fomes fomentarius]
MRTRRRPVLQDKTPGNTPQKPKAKATRSAKPKLVPVVEIKTRPRRGPKGKQPQKEESINGEEGKEEQEVPAAAAQITPIAQLRQAPSNHADQKPPVKRGRGRPRKNPAPVARDVAQAEDVHMHVDEEPEGDPVERTYPTPIDSDDGEHAEPLVEERPLAENAAAAATGLRMLPSPTSPTVRHQRTRIPLGSIPPSIFPVVQPERDSTPDSIPIAEDDSTASEAARAIMNTPSPARIIRAPIPVESTPLGRLPPLERSLRPFYQAGRQDSSIRRWNAGVTRAYSPLPPSSPPPVSPLTQVPVASSSQPQPYRYRFSSDEPDENQENHPVAGPSYVRRDKPHDDDDPFGLLAAEKKIKAMRQRREPVESSRAPGAPRAPLGTLAIDEVPSSVAIPERLPTPLPSDDHNIDDLYVDVDPVPAGPSRIDDSDDLEDEDKENVPTQDYDLNEDKENMRPPHLVLDDYRENDAPEDVLMDVGESEMDDRENVPSIPPLLLASAKKGLDELLEAPSSSSASPTHALRTPHKHRSAHNRTPLPTPHFSDGGLSDSPLTSRSFGVRNSSPSPVKPSAARPSTSAAAISRPVRQPLATLELEDPESPVPAAAKVAGKKRTRAQAEESSEDSDPRAAVRRLEALLPKRSKTRATAASKAARGGRGGAKGKGKERENIPMSGENSEEEDDDSDSSPPKPPARAPRGRGRGAARGRGRGRGRATTTPTTSARPRSTRGRSTSRGRPASKGKGKEKAVEEVDPEEDEERARQREARKEYFRKLQEYSLEKEDVYVI